MQYDPIKNRLESLIGHFPSFRKAFYLALDALLLRQAYVKRAIRAGFKSTDRFRFYDAGAGFCQYSHYVLSSYPYAKVFATDLKKDYLRSFARYCLGRYDERFSYQTADLVSFVPNLKYDLVIAIDILEHIEDDLGVLRNFREAMNPDGVLIISTPSELDEAARFTAEHVRPGYNKAALENKLQDCGFEISESRYTYGKCGALAWKLLMKYPLQALGKSKLSAILLPFYYLLVYPLAYILNQMDLQAQNTTGTGILVVAKPCQK